MIFDERRGHANASYVHRESCGAQGILDVVTQLDMLRSTQNTTEMRKSAGSPILKLMRHDFFKKASKTLEGRGLLG